MSTIGMTDDFWACLDRLVAGHQLVIERPKGGIDPGHPEMVYPLDYVYLEGTISPDGEGIDVWVGSEGVEGVRGVACTVDLAKGGSEVKILLGCSDAEMKQVASLLDIGLMRCLVVRRGGQGR